MRRAAVVAAAAAAAAARARVSDPPGTYCTGGPSADAVPNLYPITEPTIVHEADAPHGRLFSAQHKLGNASYPVLHLYGTPYQMGFAHGTLLRERCRAMWAAFWEFLVDDAGDEGTLNTTLGELERTSAPFVPSHLTEEMRGLAAATGVDYQRILWLHLYPETADGHCSMFGAWGSATQGSMGGKLLQMRALDYITADFLSHNHMLTVYHPPAADGRAFVNVGFVGTVSAVTGISGAPLALSQIGVSNPDLSFGPQRNGRGIPFNFLLRDLLQRDGSLAEAKARITAATRTVDIILGIGDGGSNSFTGVQYSAQHARFYGDTDLLPKNDSWHAPIDNVVYQGMDWLCPGWTKLLGDKLRELHGSLTPEVAVREINPIVQTGDLHIAIYEVEKQVLYASFSSGTGAPPGAPTLAYQRPFLRFDAARLMAEPAPPGPAAGAAACDACGTGGGACCDPRSSPPQFCQGGIPCCDCGQAACQCPMAPGPAPATPPPGPVGPTPPPAPMPPLPPTPSGTVSQYECTDATCAACPVNCPKATEGCCTCGGADCGHDAFGRCNSVCDSCRVTVVTEGACASGAIPTCSADGSMVIVKFFTKPDCSGQFTAYSYRKDECKPSTKGNFLRLECNK